MGADHLIRFRTAYLRLVASCWVDDLENSATKPKRSALARLTGRAGMNVLKDFGADLGAWDGLDVHFGSEGPEWDPDLADWVDKTGSSGAADSESVLLIRLPVLGAPPEQYRALALADFYQQRPTIFTKRGADKFVSTMCSSMSPREIEELVQAILSRELGLGEYIKFEEFGGLILRALALAWQNSTFAGMLMHGDARVALQRWLGYASPWIMKLQVVNDATAKWSQPSAPSQDPPPTPELKAQSSWTFTEESNNRLTLFVPKMPGTAPKLHTIALAAYNNTGPAHPFTCCA